MNNIGFENDKIFLLSVVEYKRYIGVIPPIPCWWWLRSPGNYSDYAAFVNFDGSVYHSGFGISRDFVAVRPALKFGNLQISESKKPGCFVFNEIRWKIIDSENKIAISEMPLWFGAFDSKSNDYGTSEVRKQLLDWLKEAENETD